MEKHRIFDTELEKLTRKVTQMCELVNQQVDNTLHALLNCDNVLANQIIENDVLVDKLDVKIDKLCQNIFALQQPVASDLRFILSSLKINNDLERTGDHAVSIAKRIEAIADYPDILEELGIPVVCEATTLLFKDVVSLVKSHNMVFSIDIFNNAAEIKEKCHEISEKILDEMMHKTEVIVVATNIMVIVNLIERIASYSTNIAESIVFVVEGKIVKHKKKFYDSLNETEEENTTETE
ncbi:MAG: phosphate signaling complex protein PhoU [Bacteroidota bacterium]